MTQEPKRIVMDFGRVTHVIPPVEFGYITVRFENGTPTLIERHENTKLGGGKVAEVAK